MVSSRLTRSLSEDARSATESKRPEPSGYPGRMEWTAGGTLTIVPALRHPELVATPVADALTRLDPEVAETVGVAEIDPALADTAEFCARYGVAMDVAAATCRFEGALLRTPSALKALDPDEIGT